MIKKYWYIILILFLAVGVVTAQYVGAVTSTYSPPFPSEYNDVPTADATDNSYSRDVIGNKEDSAASGAVSTEESIMAYVKQLVGGQIIIDAFHDVATADATTNTVMSDVIGNKTDAAVNAATTTKTIMAYTKGVLNEIAVPSADNTDNGFINDVIGQKTDAAAAGAVTTTDTLVGYTKQLVTAELVTGTVQEMSISKVLTGITNGNNDLFTVTGGPIKILEITAYVTTEIEGKSCLINYNIDPATPATDTAFATDGTALEINGDAVGTLYTWDGVVANDLTATTNGVALGVAAVSGLIVPAGSIELAAVVDTSATGAITVYMRYIPLSTSSVVAAAS